ncbi:hypothetical protein BEL04_08145 [Mucilaginibacter sp. PPCGB 2223]|uniref:HEPN domain-containing protein n=1 Tax=Mucilaginibacter sp. PPCGB 2223 TaxID=1886027 RepID=UPI000826B844|nr:HEPN domain-containing protein [Mucilaginibacter sp. PPCGB 2223]OCX54220.1 hypothetical protein BEL04_08145 [Mucilaginibacter sp. PPCGB 2223]
MFDELNIFLEKVINFHKSKSSDKIDLFAYFIHKVKEIPEFTAQDIKDAFTHLKLVPYSNINQYLKDNSDKARPKKKKVKFLKKKVGYCLEGHFEKEVGDLVKDADVPFINYSVNSEHLEWKPSDIPFITSKTKKSADFFAKLYYVLYHLENSLRKFIAHRLSKIIGVNWETSLTQTVDLSKAESIRNDVSLSEMLPERGDNILFYCMWDDYGKIIKGYPNMFSNSKESDEILAHVNSMTKIRNAIAHNASTIPKDYQDEFTVFLKKYIKIMKIHAKD